MSVLAQRYWWQLVALPPLLLGLYFAHRRRIRNLRSRMFKPPLDLESAQPRAQPRAASKATPAPASRHVTILSESPSDDSTVSHLVPVHLSPQRTYTFGIAISPPRAEPSNNCSESVPETATQVPAAPRTSISEAEVSAAVREETELAVLASARASGALNKRDRRALSSICCTFTKGDALFSEQQPRPGNGDCSAATLGYEKQPTLVPALSLSKENDGAESSANPSGTACSSCSPPITATRRNRERGDEHKAVTVSHGGSLRRTLALLDGDVMPTQAPRTVRPPAPKTSESTEPARRPRHRSTPSARPPPPRHATRKLVTSRPVSREDREQDGAREAVREPAGRVARSLCHNTSSGSALNEACRRSRMRTTTASAKPTAEAARGMAANAKRGRHHRRDQHDDLVHVVPEPHAREPGRSPAQPHESEIHRLFVRV